MTPWSQIFWKEMAHGDNNTWKSKSYRNLLLMLFLLFFCQSCRKVCEDELLHVKGVFSFTFDEHKKRFTLRTKLELQPEVSSLGHSFISSKRPTAVTLKPMHFLCYMLQMCLCGTLVCTMSISLCNQLNSNNVLWK